MAAEKSTPMDRAASASDALTLSHVNTPPAQTWNYLRINDVSFDVPAPSPSSTGAAFNRLPQIFSKVETGLGDEAVDWPSSSPSTTSTPSRAPASSSARAPRPPSA